MESASGVNELSLISMYCRGRYKQKPRWYDGPGSVFAPSNTDGEIEEQYSYDVYGMPSSARKKVISKYNPSLEQTLINMDILYKAVKEARKELRRINNEW